AYANSADGKNGFYVGGGGTNLLFNSNFSSGLANWHINLGNNKDGKVVVTTDSDGDTCIHITGTGASCGIYSSPSPFNQNQITTGSVLAKGTGRIQVVGLESRLTSNFGIVSTESYSKVGSTTQASSNTNAFVVYFSPVNNVVDVYIKFVKLEQGDKDTPWSPAPSEAHPSYIGQYTDFSSTASTDPAKYAPWTVFKGNDGVGIKTTDITYAFSTSGTTAPTSGWTSSIPSPISGQYFWTKTVFTYTDNSSKTGYSVNYISKDGSNGDPGKVVSDTEPTTRFKGLTWKYSGTVDLTASDGTVIKPNTEYYYNGTHWVINFLSANNIDVNSITAEKINGTDLEVKNGKFTDGVIETSWKNGTVTGSTNIQNDHLIITRTDSSVNTTNSIGLDSTQGLIMVYTENSTGRTISVGTNFQGMSLTDSTGISASISPAGVKLSSDVNWTKIGNIGGRRAEWKRENNRVTMNIHGGNGDGFPVVTSGGTLLGILPTNARPPSDISMPATAQGAGATAQISINSTGEVRCYRWGGDSVYFGAYISYYVE
ncbi:hypothetical protein ACN9TE_12105, partial [Lactococcus lactis]